LTSEAKLEGRRIDEYFSPEFFSTEFWLIYSSIMGSLPQHGATELRRYLNRTLHLFPYLSNMARILRTPVDQYEAFVVPLVAWLRQQQVTFLANTFVQDIHFAPSPDRITVDRLDYEHNGAATSVAIAPEDLVIATIGSQGADISVGSMATAAKPRNDGREWELWKRLAQGRSDFGRPDVFFDADKISDSRWVTFTVTTTGKEFLEQMTALTGNETGTGGLVTLKDSSWLLSLSVFHQPEVVGQPEGTYLWWGYGLFPERTGDYVKKRMDQCTGAEILEEALRHLRFDQHRDAIVESSICIPCNLPYVNNIWLPRRHTDRPPPVPQGSTNFGLIGQYVEVPRDVAFTIEYSARAAWEAVHLLLKRGPAPPPVYQAQRDPKALLGALKVFLFK
jgi:oleate hydratase